MDQACTERLVEDTYRYWQQFGTPQELAERMVGMITAGENDVILEPSAGRGGMVAAILGSGRKALAVEIEPTAMAVMRYRFKEEHAAKQVYFNECSFLDFHQEYGPNSASRLRFPGVVAHPPHLNRIDMAHTMAAYQMLKPGGMLVTILSHDTCFAEDSKAETFRAWLSNVGAEYEELPVETFAGGYVHGLLTWLVAPNNLKQG
jgi:hypothetical protein